MQLPVRRVQFQGGLDDLGYSDAIEVVQDLSRGQCRSKGGQHTGWFVHSPGLAGYQLSRYSGPAGIPIGPVQLRTVQTAGIARHDKWTNHHPALAYGDGQVGGSTTHPMRLQRVVHRPRLAQDQQIDLLRGGCRQRLSHRRDATDRMVSRGDPRFAFVVEAQTPDAGITAADGLGIEEAEPPYTTGCKEGTQRYADPIGAVDHYVLATAGGECLCTVRRRGESLCEIDQFR